MAEENVLIRARVQHGGTSNLPHINLDGVILEFVDHAKMRHMLLSFSEGAWVWNITKRIRKPRSSNQNRYYHGIVVKMIAEETCGVPASKEDCDAIHRELAKNFLGSTEVTNGGFTFEVIKSTTDLSTVEMEEYLEMIRRWADVDLNLYIPKPNEVEIP
jgi:hypothetical protein